MKTALLTITMLTLSASTALAQQAASRPAMGIGSKGMEMCSGDQRKFCAKTPDAVVKECLVTNWTRITSDCQDALGTPVDRINGRGSRGD